MTRKQKELCGIRLGPGCLSYRSLGTIGNFVLEGRWHGVCLGKLYMAIFCVGPCAQVAPGLRKPTRRVVVLALQ